MATKSTPDDPLALAPLFEGGGEPWLPILKPVLEARPDAAKFIGPDRVKTIVPVRELTFQALKPNPPERWRIVAFGQNPYPRIESATGIAMFDNAFHAWSDKRFEYVASMRNLIKAALVWRHGIDPNVDVWALRKLLAEHQVVAPPEWFQALLAQGVLLLNAALTASADNKLPIESHTAFWRPAVEAVVEAILAAKVGAEKKHRGVVFAWWGNHARLLKPMVERLQQKYPDVPVRHVDHWNPAARDDRFYRGNHFKDLNTALLAVGAARVGWLPTPGWQERLLASPETGEKMGGFIKDTMELHRMYLERLSGARDEVAGPLPPITGVLDRVTLDFRGALAPVRDVLPGIEYAVRAAQEYGAAAAKGNDAHGLDADEVAALHLYTMGSGFYAALNAALRDHDRARVRPYLAYLKLFFSAFERLPEHTDALWRGVGLDLRAQYPRGATVTWWGVSSCSTKRSVAEAFSGGTSRTLFEVRPRGAASIKRYSAFAGEDEVVLLPGTQLRVAGVEAARHAATVTLEALDAPRLVS